MYNLSLDKLLEYRQTFLLQDDGDYKNCESNLDKFWETDYT